MPYSEPGFATIVEVPQQEQQQQAMSQQWQQQWSGGTLNTWRSGDDGRTVAERLQVRF
jgi:hypothetical protein